MLEVSVLFSIQDLKLLAWWQLPDSFGREQTYWKFKVSIAAFISWMKLTLFPSIDKFQNFVQELFIVNTYLTKNIQLKTFTALCEGFKGPIEKNWHRDCVYKAKSDTDVIVG